MVGDADRTDHAGGRRIGERAVAVEGQSCRRAVLQGED
ncbi:hypothetical protein, partial [Roseateles sp. P5_E1]